MMFHRMGCMLAESDGIGPDQWLLIIAAIIIITLLLMQSSRRRAASGSPKQYRREIDSATTKSTAIKRDMERLLVELSELARQINGQIDTRFAKLEQSIADADKRIQFLRVLLAAAKKAKLVDSDGSEEMAKSQSAAESPAQAEADSGAAPGRLDVRVGDEGVSVVGKPESAGAGGDKDESVPPQRERGTRADRTEKGFSVQHDDKDAVSSSPQEAIDATVEEEGIDDISRRTYELADAGRTPIEIAQQLEQNLGEVELILNLRPPSEAQHPPPAESSPGSVQ